MQTAVKSILGGAMADKEPSGAGDAEILLDGEEIAGYVVRPWTITTCARMTPVFESIVEEMKRRKLKFRDFLDTSGGKLELLNMDQVFFVVMPYAPETISITLGITAEEMKKIPQEEIFNIMAAILRQNVGYLKNLFALMMQTMATIAENSSGR